MLGFINSVTNLVHDNTNSLVTIQVRIQEGCKSLDGGKNGEIENPPLNNEQIAPEQIHGKGRQLGYKRSTTTLKLPKQSDDDF